MCKLCDARGGFRPVCGGCGRLVCLDTVRADTDQFQAPAHITEDGDVYCHECGEAWDAWDNGDDSPGLADEAAAAA